MTYQAVAGRATQEWSAELYCLNETREKKNFERDKPKKSRRSNSPRGRSQSGGFAGAILTNPDGTLGQRVYWALKKDIITGQYQPGEALSEKSLAKRYHSSRTPVREAAAPTSARASDEIVPNRGYFTTQITIQWVNEIYEFRAAVEAHARNWLRRANGPGCHAASGRTCEHGTPGG